MAIRCLQMPGQRQNATARSVLALEARLLDLTETASPPPPELPYVGEEDNAVPTRRSQGRYSAGCRAAQGASKAEVVRQSIRHAIGTSRPDPRAGLFSSGPRLARQADKLLIGFGER